MVHRLLVNYGQPTDPVAFDAHYRETHAPLAQKLPGLLRYTMGHSTPMDPSHAGPYLVVELDFESEQAMGEGLGSPEGQAAVGDDATFATGGATMVHFDVHEVK
jgi:uncharacterized protein (TIGR02118 family)